MTDVTTIGSVQMNFQQARTLASPDAGCFEPMKFQVLTITFYCMFAMLNTVLADNVCYDLIMQDFV